MDSVRQSWPNRTDEKRKPELRTLSPRFQQDEHGYYADVLFDQLVRSGSSAPRNIALTGHYGSGKSSVLVEVQERLNSRRRHLRRFVGRQGGKALNVSLSSLGTNEPPVGRIGKDGATPELTNLIQKEIVKQLLYRARPRRMRGSRFRRLDVFHGVSAAAWSIVLATAVGAVGVLLGLLDRIVRVMPNSWVEAGSWVPWAVVGAMALVGSALGWSAARALHNRVRIGDASAGPVKVSLTDGTTSFFDAYLDELVYFFQASRTSVVIFEDLDRFKDPNIFESLRELNAVLSNAEQITNRPVRFVYAITDSIFETIADADHKQLEPPVVVESVLAETRRTSKSTSTPAPPDKAAEPPVDLEAQRNATRNRTKFFDLVVPVVPFISHRNARELVRGEFKGTGIREDLLDLIAPYLTDMRLLRNIRNEYDVFASQILPPRGPEGLESHQLLAMITYKNLHLTDFEAIREGESVLDDLYRMYRDAVTESAMAAEDDANEARSALNILEAGPAEVVALGARLRWMANLMAAMSAPPSRGVLLGTTTFTLEELSDPAFWRAWAEAGTKLGFVNNYGQVTGYMTPEDAQTQLGVTLDANRWDEQQRALLERREREALSLARHIERASLQGVINDPRILVPREDEPSKPLLTIADGLVDNLTLALITSGFLLDENYTLYVARFHVGTLSLRAMNFILHNVQTNRRDVRFQFDDAGSIDAVVAEEGSRFLDGDAVFNLEVFDHLLPTAPVRLSSAIARLTDGTEDSEQFLNAYLAGDGHTETLIRLLAPQWPGVFTYLATEGRLRPDLALHLSDVAAQAASPEVLYEVTPDARAVAQKLTAYGAVFVDANSLRDLAALTALLRTFDLEVADLSRLTDVVCAEMVRQSLYPVTGPNLRTAIDNDELELDHIFDADRVVYEHVRAHLETYLDDALDAGRFALTSRGPWRHVLEDIAEHRPELLQPVVERSSPEVRAGSLDELSRSTWGVLARTGRFAFTASNVVRYVTEFSADEDLGTYLTHVHDTVEVDIAAPEAAVLALTLLNSAALPPNCLVPLVQQLKSSPFGIGDLTPEAAPALPRLIAVGLMPDDAAAYEFLSGCEWELRRELVIASSAFAAYAAELTLDEEEVQALATEDTIPDPVKATLLNKLPLFAGRLDATSATSLAHWARTREHDVPVASIVLLAERGVDPVAVLAMLAKHVHTMNWAEIVDVLVVIGEPYKGLMVTGDKRRLDLPASAGLRAVLDRLRALVRVTSYDERENGNVLGVRRKVNPPS